VRRRAAVVPTAEAPVVAADEADDGAAIPEGTVAYIKSIFTDVLGVHVPAKLGVFLAVLQGSDYAILGKDEWRTIDGDMHPFLMPLAVRGAGSDDVEVAGLLVRQPNGAALRPEEFQVVTMKPKTSRNVILVATDMEKYIMKRAEEAHFRKEVQDMPVIEATKDVYDVRFGGGDRTALDKWLLLEVGSFPDVYKNLALEHIEGEDPKTGLVIADTMRDVFGTSWGFPHAFCCRVLREHFDGKGPEKKRGLEADHCAVRCFTTGYPLWTLEDEGDSLQELLLEAKMPKLGDINSLRVFYLKRSTDDQRAAVRTGSISLGCATLAKGQALMDAVCCGHKSYAGIRQELQDLYDEVPGCEPLVEMIAYFAP